jgi:hypothetical protein
LRDVQPPAQARMVLASGWMGAGDKNGLPVAWRDKTLVVYPFDAPVRWDARMMFNLRPWLAEKSIAVTDERLQGNTFAACNIFAETLRQLRGVPNRDRLVELIESYSSAMGNAPAAEVYPRFSLGPGQRYSSKGAYIARFAKDAGEEPKLELERDWIIP